ncbi:MAG: outer membrane beta-barrel protein [Deltaproteobacteria bacterium]|nr:outer membrane beta-barrel protein [Deltaproteobacteria bacterium]
MDRATVFTALALVLLALPATALAGDRTPGARHDASESRSSDRSDSRDARDAHDRRDDDRHDAHDRHDNGRRGHDTRQPRDERGHHVAYPGSGPHRPPHGPPPPRYRHPPRVYHVYHPAPPPVVVAHPAPAPRPAPQFSRAGDVSVGLNAGSLLSGYQGGPAWTDGGLGLEARYRLTDGFGLAMGLASFGSASGERVTTPFGLDAQFFGFSNGPVNPFFELGFAVTSRDWEDAFHGLESSTYTADDTSLGAHAGLGLEIALGRHAALDLEVGLLGIPAAAGPEDPAFSTAFQSGIGLQWYF